MTFLMQYTRLNYIHYHQRYCHIYVFDVKKDKFYIELKLLLMFVSRTPWSHGFGPGGQFHLSESEGLLGMSMSRGLFGMFRVRTDNDF